MSRADAHATPNRVIFDHNNFTPCTKRANQSASYLLSRSSSSAMASRQKSFFDQDKKVNLPDICCGPWD